MVIDAAVVCLFTECFVGVCVLCSDGTTTLFLRTVLAAKSTRKSDVSSTILCDRTFTRSSWKNTLSEYPGGKMTLCGRTVCLLFIHWCTDCDCFLYIDLHTHTHNRITALFPGQPRWADTTKVKPIWILLKQETVHGNGIHWAICKSAPCSRQITTPAPHRSVFTGRMPFLLPIQQHQSTEGIFLYIDLVYS